MRITKFLFVVKSKTQFFSIKGFTNTIFFTFKLYPSIIKDVTQLQCCHWIPVLLGTPCTPCTPACTPCTPYSWYTICTMYLVHYVHHVLGTPSTPCTWYTVYTLYLVHHVLGTPCTPYTWHTMYNKKCAKLDFLKTKLFRFFDSQENYKLILWFCNFPHFRRKRIKI